MVGVFPGDFFCGLGARHPPRVLTSTPPSPPLQAAGSGGVKQVAIKGSDGAWKDLSNKYGSAW